VTKEDIEIFVQQLCNVHVKTTTIKNDNEGEAMMSNIFQGYIVKVSKTAVFMGSIYEDSDKFDITASISLEDISAVSLAEEEVPDFLIEMPGEEDEVH